MINKKINITPQINKKPRTREASVELTAILETIKKCRTITKKNLVNLDTWQQYSLSCQNTIDRMMKQENYPEDQSSKDQCVNIISEVIYLLKENNYISQQDSQYRFQLAGAGQQFTRHEKWATITQGIFALFQAKRQDLQIQEKPQPQLQKVNQEDNFQVKLAKLQDDYSKTQTNFLNIEKWCQSLGQQINLIQENQTNTKEALPCLTQIINGLQDVKQQQTYYNDQQKATRQHQEMCMEQFHKINSAFDQQFNNNGEFTTKIAQLYQKHSTPVEIGYKELIHSMFQDSKNSLDSFVGEQRKELNLLQDQVQDSVQAIQLNQFSQQDNICVIQQQMEPLQQGDMDIEKPKIIYQAKKIFKKSQKLLLRAQMQYNKDSNKFQYKLQQQFKQKQSLEIQITEDSIKNNIQEQIALIITPIQQQFSEINLIKQEIDNLLTLQQFMTEKQGNREILDQSKLDETSRDIHFRIDEITNKFDDLSAIQQQDQSLIEIKQKMEDLEIRMKKFANTVTQMSKQNYMDLTDQIKELRLKNASIIQNLERNRQDTLNTRTNEGTLEKSLQNLKKEFDDYKFCQKHTWFRLAHSLSELPTDESEEKQIEDTQRLYEILTQSNEEIKEIVCPMKFGFITANKDSVKKHNDTLTQITHESLELDRLEFDQERVNILEQKFKYLNDKIDQNSKKITKRILIKRGRDKLKFGHQSDKLNNLLNTKSKEKKKMVNFVVKVLNKNSAPFYPEGYSRDRIDQQKQQQIVDKEISDYIQNLQQQSPSQHEEEVDVDNMYDDYY